MGEWREVTLGDVASSLGGLWGQPEPADGLVGVLALRGTDFAKVRAGDLSSVPRRFEKKKAVEKRLLDERSIVIEASGGSRDQPVGRSLLIRPTLLEHAGMPISAASFCKILWVDDEVANPRFIHGVIENLYQSGEIEQYLSSPVENWSTSTG